MKHNCLMKKYFYSNLNIKCTKNVDYRHARRVFKKFEINYLGNYHGLYVQSDALMFADLFKTLETSVLKCTYDLAYFLSAHG